MLRKNVMAGKTRGKAGALIVKVARGHRRAPTVAVEKLWQSLRNRKLAGLKFRRQHPYERFVLDAFCVEHQLEIEVDGDVHADPVQAAHDRVRAEFLEERGIRVLRFSNEDVEQNLVEVLRQIVSATKNP
jgi:very-short-patch-repair endonuclease